MKEIQGKGKMKAYHGTSIKFEEFNLNFTCDLGFHFGSASQAQQRLVNVTGNGDDWIILECELNLNNPITAMPDIGDWSDHQVLSEAILDTQKDERLRAISHEYLNEPYKSTGVQPHEKMKEKIQSLGYDGIVYDNVAEGGLKSYLVFEPGNIKIVQFL